MSTADEKKSIVAPVVAVSTMSQGEIRAWERNVMLERLLLKTEELFDTLIADIAKERASRDQ